MKYPGVRRAQCLFALCVAKGRQCGREGRPIPLKPISGWESRADPHSRVEGTSSRMRAPEKALVLGSQRESPSVPPALLFPKKLVL